MVSATDLATIRSLTLTPDDQESSAYIYNFELSELLKSYLNIDLFSLKRNNATAYRDNIVSVIDRRLDTLLASPTAFQQFRFVMFCLVLIRDRVVTEIEAPSPSSAAAAAASDAGAGLLETTADVQGGFAISSIDEKWMENRTAVGANASAATAPSWARVGSDQLTDLKRRITNPYGQSKALNAFYRDRKVRYDIIVKSDESDNRTLPSAMRVHSSFRFQLSVQLSNIESLYLTEVSFNSLPETISDAYGSNFIILEPRVYGLVHYAEEKFRVVISVKKGSYATPNDLVNAANDSIQSLAVNPGTQAYLDFGTTRFSFNPIDEKVTFHADLGINFHQDSFRFVWLHSDVRDALGFNELQTYHSFCSISSQYVRVINAATDASNSITVADGSVKIRYTIHGIATPKLEHTIQLLTPGSVYNFYTFVAQIQSQLKKDALFGKYSSFTVTTTAIGSRVLTLTLLPDTSVRSALAPWWNALSTCEAGGVQMEVLFQGTADRSKLWFGNNSVCGFLPHDEETGLYAPNVMLAQSAYQSTSYVTDAADSLNQWPSAETIAAKVQKNEATLLYYHTVADPELVSNKYVTWFSPQPPRQLIYSLSTDFTPTAHQTTGVWMRAVNRNYSWLDEFFEIDAGTNFTFSRLMNLFRSKFAASSRMSKTEFDVSDVNANFMQWKVDYAYKFEGRSNYSSVTWIDLTPENMQPSVSQVFADVSSDPTTDSESAFVLVCKENLALNSFYRIGKFQLVAEPTADCPDRLGASITVEDYRVFTDVNSMIRELNNHLRNYTDPEFGNVWSASLVVITSFLQAFGANGAQVTLQLNAVPTKTVTESNFELCLVGDSLWPDLGFPSDQRVFALDERAQVEYDASGTTVVGQRAYVTSPDKFKKVVSVFLEQRLGTVSYGSTTYVQVGRVEAVAPGVAVPGGDPMNLYSFPLLLPVNEDLSVEMIVAEFNAQLIARFYSATESAVTGRWGPRAAFSIDSASTKVRFTALFSQRFDSRDYDLIVYNNQLSSKCFKNQSAGGLNSTFRFTLGYILGFQRFLQYDLSQYVDEETGMVALEASSAASASLVNNSFFLMINDFTGDTSATKTVSSMAQTSSSAATYDTSLTTLPSYVKTRRSACEKTRPTTFYEEAVQLFIDTRRNGTNGLTLKQLYNAVTYVKLKWERQNNVQSIEKLLAVGGPTPYKKGELRGDVPTEYLERQTPSILLDNNVFGVLHFQSNEKTKMYDLVTAPVYREYTGPKKLRFFHIALMDQYSNLIPLSSSWTLKFAAFAFPEDPYKSVLGMEAAVPMTASVAPVTSTTTAEAVASTATFQTRKRPFVEEVVAATTAPTQSVPALAPFPVATRNEEDPEESEDSSDDEEDLFWSSGDDDEE